MFMTSRLELPAYELLLLLRSERSLQERVSEAADLLLSSGFSVDEEGEERKSPVGEGSEQKQDGKTGGKGECGSCDLQ